MADGLKAEMERWRIATLDITDLQHSLKQARADAQKFEGKAAEKEHEIEVSIQ